MGKREELMSRASALARELVELEGRIASMPEPPEDDFLPGDVVMVEVHFTNQRHGEPYVYAAAKAGDGRWYPTGTAFRGQARSWEDMIEAFSNRPFRSFKIFRATEWEEVEL